MSKINTDLAILKLEKSRLKFSRFPNHEVDSLSVVNFNLEVIST